MHRTRIEIFDESNRKRPAPSEPTDGLDQAKRQRVVAEAPNRGPAVPPLPAGDVSWRQLYTLNPEGSTVNFDVQAFKDPEQLLRIVVPVLQHVDAQKLDHAINVREPMPMLAWLGGTPSHVCSGLPPYHDCALANTYA
jgi:symplekin